jgi:hypothetical protein
MLSHTKNEKAQIKRPFFDPLRLIIRDLFFGLYQYRHNLRMAFLPLREVFCV